MKSRARRQANAPAGNRNWQPIPAWIGPNFRQEPPSRQFSPILQTVARPLGRLHRPRMNSDQLYRLSGVAAVTGGALRIVSAFPLVTDPSQQQWLWVIIDIFLTLGMIGIYLSRDEKLGLIGIASLVI